MGLDWDLPPYPPPTWNDQGSEPIQVTVVTSDSKEDLHRELNKLNLAIEQNPDNPESYRQRASFFARLGDLQKAVADYDVAIQRKSKSSDSPSVAEWYRQRGQLQSRLGHFVKAVDDYSECILRQPSAAAFYSRGWN
jgi:tetratricopeptide (TPR) repeat protein